MVFAQKMRWFLFGKTSDAQRVRRIFKIAFLLLLFVGLFWIVPIQKVAHALLAATPLFFGLGLATAFVSTVLNAVELEPLVRQQNIKRHTFQILGINLTAKFYSLFAPASIVGSGFRWYRLALPEGKLAEALAAMASFRLLEIFLSISLGLGFWLLSGQQMAGVQIEWLAALILLIVLAWLAVTRLSMPFYLWFKSRTERLWQRKFLQIISHGIEKFLQAISTYARMPLGNLFLAVCAGISSQFAGMFSYVFMAKAVGIELPFVTVGWIYCAVILLTQLPFVFAGGLGVREVALVAILSVFHISADLALAFSFLLFVRGIFLSLLGGGIEAVQVLRSRHLAVVGPDDLREKDKVEDT